MNSTEMAKMLALAGMTGVQEAPSMVPKFFYHVVGDKRESNSNSLLKVLGILGFLPKPQKTASNKLAKLLCNFVSLAKFPLHLANMSSPPSLSITCVPIC